MERCSLMEIEESETILLNLLSAQVINGALSKSSHFEKCNWRYLLERFVIPLAEAELSQIQCNSLPQIPSLVVSIVIIGSQLPGTYPMAIHMLSSWRGCGGYYWVILSELMRHFALWEIEQAISTSQMSKLNVQIDLPAVLINEHPNLKAAFHKLDVSIKRLITSLRQEKSIESQQNIFSEYVACYSIDRFASWAIEWLETLLLKSLLPENHLKDSASIYESGKCRRKKRRLPEKRRRELISQFPRVDPNEEIDFDFDFDFDFERTNNNNAPKRPKRTAFINPPTERKDSFPKDENVFISTVSSASERARASSPQDSLVTMESGKDDGSSISDTLSRDGNQKSFVGDFTRKIWELFTPVII